MIRIIGGFVAVTKIDGMLPAGINVSFYGQPTIMLDGMYQVRWALVKDHI